MRACPITVLPCFVRTGTDHVILRARSTTRCRCWQTPSRSPVGVDTHKHTHTAAVVAAATGQALANLTVPATPDGYQQLLELAARQPGQRIWAIESTGGYGAGLTRLLHVTRKLWWNWIGPSGPPGAMAPSLIR